MNGSAKLLAGRAVLVVDDNPTVRRIMTQTLEAAGVPVLEASSASAAEQLLGAGGSTSIGLVVSDIVMPGFPGDKLAARIAEQWPGVPVLLVSGFGMKAGCTGPFLAKPFTPDAFLRAVEELLQASRPSEGIDSTTRAAPSAQA
jgi:two-component system, cell cycle sensor histidine kinase and response regulator CckA